MAAGIFSPLLLLPLLLQIDPAPEQGRLRGHVVDSLGASVPAMIRVIRQDTNTVALRLQAGRDGSFETSLLAPVVYSLTAYAQGFRRRELSKIVIPAGRVVELGQIRLDVLGCDTPGIICDYFGDVPDDVKRIIASGAVTLDLSCAVHLDRKSQPVCPVAADQAASSSDADLRLAKDNGILYLIAQNGAMLCQPDGSTSDCSGVGFKSDRIRLAGLGPGVDFCVRTKRKSVSHVFVTDDVENDSNKVKLWYVTRRRP